MSEIAELIERMRQIVDDQEGGDAVILVQRQLFNRTVGALATLTARVAELERERDEARQCSRAALAGLDQEGANHWKQRDRADAAEARLAKAVEALTPSGETKAAYICEFSFTVDFTNEDGEDDYMRVDVPWTTVKEIMAAIRARATLSELEG